MQDLSWVREIDIVVNSNYEEVNKMLKDGWRLIAVSPAQTYSIDLKCCVTQMVFTLGR